jgi:hypothetical protein
MRESLHGIGRRFALRAARRGAFAALALAAFCLMPVMANAAGGTEAFLATLTNPQKKLFEEYLAAKTLHEFKLDAYWRKVSNKRALRRRKRAKRIAYTSADYVDRYPPTYKGPKLPSKLAKRWRAFQNKEKKKKKTRRSRSLPNLKDFLSHAKVQYGFVPERIPEKEFKLRYAREALAHGLTKDQVLRVYALETSGLGTADMVAGIHPIRKTGKPISTAIGYAQLLAANSSDELVQHGHLFLSRLRRMAAAPGLDPVRKQRLISKIEALKRMISAAKSIPHKWSKHVAFSRTKRGLGIHAINIDGDIGPWIQAMKLKGLKTMADRAGVGALSGAEIELMNLAGPGTGLEMMRGPARKAPTPNFFARRGYYRNTVVRGKTSVELLAALEKRMAVNIKNSGAIEFGRAFDIAAAER